jgi:acyl-CoA reductase-like NAD-dependent aldehyde dehydrogenase
MNEPADNRFRLTYSTMFDPPASLHEHFEAAVAALDTIAGREHPMTIGGREVFADERFEVRSPIDRRRLLGIFQRGNAGHARDAVAAANAAWPAWAAMPWRERVRLLRRAAALIEERVYAIAAAVAVEVGKTRMEAIGEVQESADLISWYCDRFEEADGFVRALPDDPLAGWRSRNATRLRPYGAWAIVAPFNFPVALAAGPIGAALVTGNTAVFKVASDTAWSGTLLMAVFRDAGLPAGVLNHLTGEGSVLGAALADDPGIAGITFTGSSEVGLGLVQRFAQGPWPRPCIAEMGGKNATVVSRHADVERAATGIVRSAFGLQGQKCSACSRVYVERPIAEALRARIVELTGALRVGDPTVRDSAMGPLINREAFERYARCVEQLRRHGAIDAGGRSLASGELEHGWFVAPTVARAPRDFRLWREEKFIPLVLVEAVDSVDEAIALANASPYALTAGFYGAQHEIDPFVDRIEAGVVYVNRPQGATTGAWPGYQPFGGWKGSGSTGKAIGSFWYLPLYLREQARTIVD